MQDSRQQWTVTRPPLTDYAFLSLLASIVVLALKVFAWRITGSVALLSDALETVANVGGALMAILMLRLAEQPPDKDHAFGHNKAEYFSSGLEGVLIFVAALFIVGEAVDRLLFAQPLRMPAAGLSIAAVSTLINLVVAFLLRRAGRAYDSVTLTADARHLFTDVWTTAGVIVGITLAVATGWLWLDSAVAVGVAIHVLWIGIHLIRESATGLMDVSWPDSEQATLRRVLDEFRALGDVGDIEFHAIRTRCAAARRFVEFHALVPGHWSVKRGHDLVESLEARLAEEFSCITASIHLEPSDDPASYSDEGLDRLTKKERLN